MRCVSQPEGRMMASKCFFTIAVPSFNQGPFLELCIRSLLNQDYPRELFEILLLDGGSHDSSRQVIDKYRNEFAFWRSEKDSGQAAAINEGLGRSRGNVFAWLNSDDLYLPNTLARVAEIFERYPEVQATTADAYHWELKSRSLFLAQTLPPKLWLMRATGNCVAQPSCFWRTDALRGEGGLDPRLHYQLDFELHLRLISKGFHYHHESSPRSVIIWHEDNKSGSKEGDAELEQLKHAYRISPPSILGNRGRIIKTLSLLSNGHFRYVGSVVRKRWGGPSNRLGAPTALSVLPTPLLEGLLSLPRPSFELTSAC